MLRKRILILSIVLSVLAAGLLTRIAVLQFVSAGTLSESAFRQRIANNSIESLRGNILDRNLIPFTNRTEKCIAFVIPAFIPDSIEEQEQVCSALGVGIDYISGLNGKKEPAMLEVSREDSEAITRMAPDWVSIIHSLNRYDSGTLARHVVGYISGRDRVGQTGIEKAYENKLKNEQIIEVGSIIDAARNPIKGLGYRVKTWGTDESLNVRLTLDYHIQKIVEEVMERNNVSGAVVVEDTATGDILAIASKPDYDPDSVADYLNSMENELYNKATAAYNLGSVFKIIDAAALYEDNELNPESIFEQNENTVNANNENSTAITTNETNVAKMTDAVNDVLTSDFTSMSDILAGRLPGIPSGIDKYYCGGFSEVNGIVFKCSSYLQGGHGLLNLEQAFAQSCNSYFIELGQKIGYKGLINMADKFGLGKKTGIGDQGVAEAGGTIPKAGYHSRADIANLSIGQGALLATPLQVADITAIIANGGIKNKINIVDSLVDDNGRVVKKIRSDGGQRIISSNTAQKIRRLMEAVTEYGTATDAGMDYYGGAGGKTGSAETGIDGAVHAWFAGYFPKADPRYSIAVFIENGRYGGKAAAPVFAEIATRMKDKGY